MIGLMIGLFVGVSGCIAVYALVRRSDSKELNYQANQYREEIGRLNNELELAKKELRNELDENKSLSVKLEEAKGKFNALQMQNEGRDAFFGAMLDNCKKDFKNIAQEIFEDREKKFKEEATNPLNNLVGNLKQEIENLKINISTASEKSATSHTNLMGKITMLVDQTNSVTVQANNLASAIRGNAQFTGEWAEIQLKRILEAAGIQETTGYSYQETFEDTETGRKSKRTDFVIKMPGGRSIIIDSKNTIAGAEHLHEAKTEADRHEAVKEIIASVRKHIEEIKKSNYQGSVPNAFEFILMYIPLEEVYLLAMKSFVSIGNEKELLRDYARRNNVILVNSSSVVPVLRLIEMMWNAERSEKNHQAIKDAAEELLKRANDFVSEFNEIGESFEKVFERYQNAKKRIVDEKGNQSISKAASKLITLGVEPINKTGKKFTLHDSIAQISEEE